MSLKSLVNGDIKGWLLTTAASALVLAAGGITKSAFHRIELVEAGQARQGQEKAAEIATLTTLVRVQGDQLIRIESKLDRVINQQVP